MGEFGVKGGQGAGCAGGYAPGATVSDGGRSAGNRTRPCASRTPTNVGHASAPQIAITAVQVGRNTSGLAKVGFPEELLEEVSTGERHFRSIPLPIP